MRMTWTVVGLIALAGCSQGQTNQSQAEADNGTVQPANSGSVDAETGAPEAAPQPDSLSSGMPVPGTNTPEHIVVNDDSGTNSH
jgi:hypothetical protein